MAPDDIKVKKDRDPIMTVCFVVFLLAVCAVTGAMVHNNYLKADNSMAVNGDTVSVNYTGTYYAPYGEDGAVVFDTSFWSVANNDDITKSNDFTARAESGYSPLSFKVGGTDVLTGFGNAVIGHKVGDKIKVKLPAGEGYNAANTEKTVNASAQSSVPSSETLTSAQFKEVYGYDLRGYAEIEKSVYGWPASASYNTNNDTITVTHHPVANTPYVMVDNDFGKVTLNVASVTSNILFTYSITDYNVVSTDGDRKEIQMIMLEQMVSPDLEKENWYINSVIDSNNDGVADVFTYKVAGERYNQDLYFEIEIVTID